MCCQSLKMGRWYQSYWAKCLYRPDVRWKFCFRYAQFLHFNSSLHKRFSSFLFNFQCAHFLPFKLHILAPTLDCQSGILTDCKGNAEKRTESSWKCWNTNRQERREAQSSASAVKRCRGPVGVLGFGEIDYRGEAARGCQKWILIIQTMVRARSQQCRNQTFLQHFKASAGIIFVRRETATAKSQFCSLTHTWPYMPRTFRAAHKGYYCRWAVRSRHSAGS